MEDRTSTEVIGHVNLEAQADRWELSYEFTPAVWGRGIAQEAIQAVLQRLRQQHPDIQVVAETQSANSRSRRLLHRLGFVRVDTYHRMGAEQALYVAGERATRRAAIRAAPDPLDQCLRLALPDPSLP